MGSRNRDGADFASFMLHMLDDRAVVATNSGVFTLTPLSPSIVNVASAYAFYPCKHRVQFGRDES